MAEGKTRRYSVDFEHFENAMLTEANLGYSVFNSNRWGMSKERRQKIVGMLKRFVLELKPEIEMQKERHRAYQVLPAEKDSHPFPNGD